MQICNFDYNNEEVKDVLGVVAAYEQWKKRQSVCECILL